MPQPETRGKPIILFYSYSHRDEDLRNELAKHLTVLKRAGLIEEWYDRKIMPGEEWDGQISAHLNEAQVILLLISVDFLASKYCFDIETKRALERHQANTARVVPIILRPVHWKLAPFAALQALPKNARAVTEWPNQDQAFVNVCEGILAVVLAWKNEPERGASLGAERTDRAPASRPLRARARILDAALPRRVLKGAATALVAMLRRLDSPGLREIVEIDTSYGVGPDEVRSTKSFPLEFPVDASGRPGPLDLLIRIDSPDFEPQSQTRTLTVPPRGDSEPRVFLLTPAREGSLVVGLHLYQGNAEVAACLLRTQSEQAESDTISRTQALVSVPLAIGAFDEAEAGAEAEAEQTNYPLNQRTPPPAAAAPPPDKAEPRVQYLEPSRDSAMTSSRPPALPLPTSRDSATVRVPRPTIALPRRPRFLWAALIGVAAFLGVMVLVIRHC